MHHHPNYLSTKPSYKLMMVVMLLLLHPISASIFLLMLTVPIVTALPTYGTVFTDPCAVPTQEVDFIVVGGGSAGSVVASRLSEDSNNKVLLLEAGPEPPEAADVPLLTREVIMNPETNWNYVTEKQQNCCLAYTDQILKLPSGKGLGGTSNLNSMIYTRGNRFDYDRLESLGIKGWSYKHVLPIFIKMEDYTALHRREDHPYHGFSGQQTVSTPQYKSEMAETFLQAGAELGYYAVDCNAANQLGFTPPPVNIKDGMRWGSYHAFLEPARNRINLHILTGAQVTKVIINDDKTGHKRAVGVEYTRMKRNCSVRAKKEVILSAGTLRSPQLLMLSGIGSRKELEKFQIPVVSELPGVGQNLKDHVLLMGFNFFIDQNVSINFRRFNTTKNLELWKKSRTGPMTSSNGVEGISFFRSARRNVTPNADHPSFEISFFSDQGISPESFAKKYRNAFILEDGKDAVTLLPILLQPQSDGEVRLRSANPLDYPVVDPKYLSNPEDEKMLLEVLRIALSIGRSKAFQKFGAHLNKFGFIPGCEGLIPDSDEFWLCFIRRFSVASYHFTGTCKMAIDADPMGVVDNKLKLRGIKGLRVADASVMPEVPAGHTHAVSLLIGERVVEFIKEDLQEEKRLIEQLNQEKFDDDLVRTLQEESV